MPKQEPSDNMVRISQGMYVVRTQAGFRKALKAYRRYHEVESPISDVQGYPKEYPSLVMFGFAYGSEGPRVSARCIAVSKLHEIVQTEEARKKTAS